MNEKMQELVKRLSNVGTIIALVSAVLFILSSAGVVVAGEMVMNVVYGLCSIGVLLGILNNPQTDGVYLPFVKQDGNPDVSNKPEDNGGGN